MKLTKLRFFGFLLVVTLCICLNACKSKSKINSTDQTGKDIIQQHSVITPIAKIAKNEDLAELTRLAITQSLTIKPIGFDAEPKTYARHSAFLKVVIDKASRFPMDPSKDEWPVDKCISAILDDGFEAAKIGEGDEAIAKWFSDSILIELKAFRAKRDRETKAVEDRKIARDKFNLGQ